MPYSQELIPRPMLVSVHNKGGAHLRESQDQLADVFAKFNLADRLTRFEKGKPLTRRLRFGDDVASRRFAHLVSDGLPLR
jgi:hypothetical protein